MEDYNLQPGDKPTLRQAVLWGTEVLKEHNIADAEYDSYALLENIMSINRTYYLTHSIGVLDDNIKKQYCDAIKLRSEHIPLQHITGKTCFYGYNYNVNEHVLIPRFDTEILVEQVLKVTDNNSNVIDMCTGSGCIILTLSNEKHIKAGIGVDISQAALKVAESNKKLYNISDVTFLQSDIFKNVNTDIFNGGKADVIVSNPPYIRTQDIESLSEEVRIHDPYLALDGFEDGLHFYRNITKECGKYLKRGGWLMYEIGYDQAEDVTDILHENGFDKIKVVKDLAGLDRVVVGQLL